VDWKEELDPKHILGADDACEKFNSVIESLVEQNATLRPRRIPKKPVWMTSEVTRAIRKKRRLWKRAECGQEEMVNTRRPKRKQQIR
jgi:hypothetical protein